MGFAFQTKVGTRQQRFLVGLYIHKWYGSSVPQASPSKDSKSVDNRKATSAFQHGDVVTATGILYRYSIQTNPGKWTLLLLDYPTTISWTKMR